MSADISVQRRAPALIAGDERPTAFGRLVSASDVEQGIVSQLRKWLRDYLAEIDRQQRQDVGTLPLPRSYVISSEPERMPEDQTPTVIVVSPGTTDAPRADGRGHYVTRWQIDASIVISARGNMHALKLARLETTAIRALLVQQQLLPPLDGVEMLDVRRVDWLGERYDTLDSIDDRTICVGIVSLAYEIADVTTRHAGPLAPLLPPDPAPGPDSPVWPEAETVDVDITKTPLADDLPE